MTRDFNKYDQNADHPSRGKSSNRYNGEERSTQQPHARPNRASVDRGWENGAARSHANYRSRNPHQTSEYSPRGNWQHRDQQTGSASNYRNERYQGNDRNQDQRRARPARFDASSNSGGFRSRPSRPYDDDRQRDNRTRDSYNRSDRSRSSEPGSSRPAYNRPSNRPYRQDADNRAPNARRYNDNGSYNTNRRPAEQGRGFQSRIDDRRNNSHNRPGSGYQRPYNDTRSQGPRRPAFQRYEQQEEQPRNPRWLSRPEMRQQREQHIRQNEGQFEGDYEQFSESSNSQPEEPLDANRYNTPARRDNKPRSKYKTRSQEIHVTRLPDGRVIKGSRPAQRKNAQFWTNINADTEDLLDQVQTPAQPTEHQPDRKKAQSATSSVKKRKEGKKPRSSGPKPSQKGYKWPQATTDETTTKSE